VKGLSALLLDPARDCEELRNAFGLDYLPIVATPDELGIPYEDHFVATPDSHVLHVWYLPTNLDRGTVILSIGSSSAMNCYLFVAKLLTRNGWSVVLYEYQGYGLSTGRPSLATLSSDLEAVLDWTRAYVHRPSVSLAGISLGTIPSVAVAVRRPDAVNGVILDSPVALGEELLRFNPLFGGDAAAFVAQLLPDLVSEERIRDMRQPLLVFLHELDVLTTPQQTELLYSRAPGPKQLVRFANLQHAKGPYFSTDVYMYHTDTFLTSVWSASERP
jgi:fermentation-respiration switch protein FrsA (DUF1100 family)